MVRIRSKEESGRRMAEGSLRAFLNGKKNPNWAKSMIQTSGVLLQRGALQDIFDRLQSYKGQPRYQEILRECLREGWLQLCDG